MSRQLNTEPRTEVEIQLKLSPAELESLVEKRLAEGWYWTQPFANTPQILMPPKDDPRQQWAGMWLEYKAGFRIPHWINSERPEK